LIGEIAPVTIVEVRTNSLYGTLANAPAPAAPPRAAVTVAENMGA
jgi:hypothetical protein